MRRLYCFCIRSFICIILFLIVGILCKSNVSYREFVKDKLYTDNISFSYFKNIYNRYLGGVFPIENITNKDVSSVFNEKIEYSDISDYQDGAILKVNQNYLVPSVEEGIVVYIGEKDNYGNVVMIENNKGIDVWYGNICNPMVKIYDTVDSGTYIGEVCDSSLYLIYSQGNDFLNYRDYFQN